MKIRGFAEPGQIRCYECGEMFEVNNIGSHAASTICPNGHNRGAWIEFKKCSTYTVPVEMDASRLRRRLEDQIRKDPKAFLNAIRAIRGISVLPASGILNAVDLLHDECNCMQCQHGDSPCKGNLRALSESERNSLTVSFRDGKVDAIY